MWNGAVAILLSFYTGEQFGNMMVVIVVKTLNSLSAVRTNAL